MNAMSGYRMLRGEWSLFMEERQEDLIGKQACRA